MTLAFSTFHVVLQKKKMVPPPGIEPGSMDFQSTAMTTFAKAACLAPRVRIELT